MGGEKNGPPTQSLIIANHPIRLVRGFLYRHLPGWGSPLFEKKRTGFERRWNIEKKGFTKEGFFEIFRKRFGLSDKGGQLVELRPGDGLVGSLGVWMENGAYGWKTRAWEHRDLVFQQFRRNRPNTKIHKGRVTNWQKNVSEHSPTAVTTRGAREASGVCRGIRNKLIRPAWLGIWNPSRRPIWFYRLNKQGYRLELVWQNIEFYRQK